MKRIDFLLSAVILFFTAFMLIHYGYCYYGMPLEKRYRSPLHAKLKPGGEIGAKLGIVGSAMMISLLAYSLRKRVRFMRNWGPLHCWLRVHIFLGLVGPLLITFHSAFKLRGIMAISYWSMITVVLSGMIGRYLFAQIPRAINGKEAEKQELEKELNALNEQLASSLPADRWDQVKLLSLPSGKISSSKGERNYVSVLRCMISDDLLWWKQKRQLKKILSAEIFSLARKRRLHLRQIALLQASQELFKYWHILHLPLAQTMYLTMIIHILVAVGTGYM